MTHSVATDPPKYTQAELCKVVGLDAATVNNWVLRSVLRPEKIGGRRIRRVRLFSEAEMYRVRFITELVTHLGIAPSTAGQINPRLADAWVKAVLGEHRERQVYVLLIPTKDDGWRSMLISPAENRRGVFVTTMTNRAATLPNTPFVALPVSRLVYEVKARLSALDPRFSPSEVGYAAVNGLGPFDLGPFAPAKKP